MITSEFAIEYIQEECESCPEYKDGHCLSNSHCFEVKRKAIKSLRQLDCIYSDLLRVKHNTMNIDELIDKVYADMRGEK